MTGGSSLSSESRCQLIVLSGTRSIAAAIRLLASHQDNKTHLSPLFFIPDSEPTREDTAPRSEGQNPSLRAASVIKLYTRRKIPPLRSLLGN